MFSEKNLSELERSEIKYVVACKLRSLTKDFKNILLTDKKYRAEIADGDVCWSNNYEYKERRLVVSYSSARAEKDRKHREMLVERMVKKSTDGQIKVKDLVTNSGTKKFIKKIDGKVEVDQLKVSNDALWDGLHGIITSDKDSSASSLLAQYRQLWRIEESFRISKHDLKMRPIFHWKPNRIKAHISICYLAFALGRFAQVKMKAKGLHMSFDRLRVELSEIESSILMDASEQGKQLYLLPSPLNEYQQAIYSAFEVKRRTSAWAI